MADDGFNLRKMRKPVFEAYERMDRELQTRSMQIEVEESELDEHRAELARRRQELDADLADLAEQRAAAAAAAAGCSILGCCKSRPLPADS
mmetsp:Transcript_107887/g.310878  ORF Transcript_107887/g.310878 Transcript_107887/m.310878 type:complete len:91 (-) Transcript_107887:200-472(-)